MRISLFVPPKDGDIWSPAYPPYGLLYLASYLEKEGHEVTINDCIIEEINHDGFRRLIKKVNPDVVGISVTSELRFSALKCADIVKEVNPNILTILGGAHATVLAESIAKNCPNIDIVVRGEGEETIAELLKKKDLKKVNGIVYRKGNRIITTPPRLPLQDLDKLPFPAWHLVKMEKYFKQAENEHHLRHPATGLISARGCPNRCKFCASPKLTRFIRRHSPRYIVDEIEFLSKKYRVKDVYFLDDTFAIDIRWLKELRDELKRRKLDITFGGQARANIRKENLEVLKDMGFYFVAIGVESGSQGVLDLMGKNITVEQARNAVETAYKLGFFVKTYWLIGSPGETTEDIKQTMGFIKSLPFHFFTVAGLHLYPGTEFCESCGPGNDWWFTERLSLGV